MRHGALVVVVVAVALAAGCTKREGAADPDVTAPIVVNEVNDDVGVRDVLRIRLSEPVRADGATVEVTDEAGPVSAGATLVGEVIEVRLASPPVAPATITVTLRNLVDPAGNALLLGTARFHMPEWHRLGGSPLGPDYLLGPGLALDGPLPVVAYGSPGKLARLVDGAWQVQARQGVVVHQPGGRPLLATTSGEGASRAFVLSEVAAGAQSPLATLPVETLQRGPWVAATWNDGITVPSTLALLAWTTGVGRITGAFLREGIFFPTPELVLDPNLGDIIGVHLAVGYATISTYGGACGPGIGCVGPRVYQVTTTGWFPVSEPFPVGWSHDLATGADGEPVIAYESQGRILVARHDPALGWQQLGAASLEAVSGPRFCSLAIDGEGRPWVAYDAWEPQAPLGPVVSRVRVARWDGSAFVPVGGTLESPRDLPAAMFPDLVVGDDGTVTVAFTEWAGGEAGYVGSVAQEFDAVVKVLNR